ncbi:MAG: DUF5106 domain-containing protein [Muribaculaceae bacterium]|nr:DUF5106 domain-containing protein [Muribaculaceae bacterium]
MKKLIYIFLFVLAFFSNSMHSQTVIEITPLFDYPVAPDEIVSLEEKCNYVVKNFWDKFDFKRKDPVDQYALNEAFGVYVSAIRYASGKVVDQSVDKLNGKLSGNPGLQLQFTKAAEENLYGPRADFWSDSLYLKFLDALIKNKKINEARKTKYISQAKSIRESGEGNVAPTFEFKDKENLTKNYFPMSTPTMLIFGDPSDTDWRIARLKMESNLKFKDAVDKGKINVLYIIPHESDNWQKNVLNYNSHWTIGISPSVNNIYDTRLNPSIYIVGQDGIIKKKFPLLDEAMMVVLESLN